MMFISKSLLAFAVLVFLSLGYIFTSSPSFWASNRSAGTKGMTKVINSRLKGGSIPYGVPSGSGNATFSMASKSALAMSIPAHTPLYTPAPTSTALPLSTSPPPIINNSSPPVVDSLTRLPRSTATPTATDSPTPSPTATDGPVRLSASLSAPANLPLITLTVTLTATPQSEISHVIIITIDGLRPDALLTAEAPHLDDLIAKGAYSPNAQTVNISETLPSHAAMLSGMTPEKNGIMWGTPYIGWPGMNGPTLFSVVHWAGLNTAMIFGKQKLNYLVLPNSVDRLFGVDAHDPEIKDQAIEMIEDGLPAVMFIHFPDTDRVGHAYGWLSQNQLYAIAFVDGLIGEIVDELKSEGDLNSTLLIITADHGGHGLKHGDDTPEDRTIPWLAVGPGVPSGLIITQNINTYDTAATTLYALDLPIPETWDGRPVLEIFQ